MRSNLTFFYHLLRRLMPRQHMDLLHHPSSNPDFDRERRHEIWYMAHPLASDERFIFAQNMNHVIHLMRIFYEEGYYVVAPYHTICLALDDDNPDWRRIGLEVDCNMVRTLGWAFMTGHKMSSGMMNEFRSCMECSGAIIYNLVGFSDEAIRTYLRGIRGGRVPEKV